MSKETATTRVIHGTDAQFAGLLKEHAAVVVDCYADWCAPCKMMAPAVDEVARQRAGRLLVGQLDTDRNPTMAVRFAIRGIPTLILYREGREAARQTGALPGARLSAWLDDALARTGG